MSAPHVSVALLDLDDTGYAAEDPFGLTPGDLTDGVHIGDTVQRRRFLATCREVRLLLGDALDRPPAEVAIRRGRNGKPEIDGAPLHFAVASRGASCAVTLSSAHPVGVQMAPVRADPPAAILMSVLPARVRFAVLNAPAEVRPREFALWWCRVEAAVRASGSGLDEAQACLAATPQEARLLGLELAVAVAGRTVAHRGVRWEGALPSPVPEAASAIRTAP